MRDQSREDNANVTDLIISGPQVYSEQGILHNVAVVIRDGIIHSIEKKGLKEDFCFPSSYHLIPGLIDLHVHGANNSDVMDATPSALDVISKALAAEGTTAFLATTMTASADQIEKTLSTIRNFMQKQHEIIRGAAILGVHLEGPFISVKKVGAQNAKNILLPSIEYFERWQKISGNTIKLVTLAPELQNSAELIRYLKKNKIIASIGHSDATYAETLAAIKNGCGYVTHLFNAMRGIHQREPGVVTAALLSEEVLTELIVDGVHLHPAIVRLILKLKGKEKMILVTDAMRAKCLSDGIYELGGQSVEVKQGIASLPDGTLAGSVLQMPTAIKKILDYTQCSLFDAVKMASENPAKAIGVFDKKGSIALKKDADFVVLDENLNVVLTVCGGRVQSAKRSPLVPLPL